MRSLQGRLGCLIALWAAGAAAYSLYTAYIGYLEPRVQRSLHLLLFLPLIFVLYPAGPRSPRDRPSAMDWLLAVAAIAPSLYSWHEAYRINMRLEEVDSLLPAEIVLGSLAVLLVLEALRRAVTPVLAGILVIMLGYLFLTEYMPGLWNYPDIPYARIVESMYLSNGQGIYGSITGVAATLVAIFIIFGAVVEGSGVGRLFANLGSLLAGRFAGGPAKVAVLTSAMFGTVSGSSTSNVFTTGSFTIPMMKRLGYRPAFAGAVEVSASVGGQITPPIMGTAAFIMSEMTDIPYVEIIAASLLGAICYFFMLLTSVHLEARKLGLRGMRPEELPAWREVLADAHLFLPILVLVVLLVLRFSPHFAAFYAILAVVVVANLRSRTRLTPHGMFKMLATGGRNVASVTVACVGAGMVVSALTKTGLILSIGAIITDAAGGVLWIAGLLLMLTTLLMGMGVPTSAAYIITAAIGAPTLVTEFGVPTLAAHLFVFYFAILAEATPPVSIASYAAASIAKAPPIATGLHALRLSTAGFVLGLSFLFNQSLMLRGTLSEIALHFALMLAAVTIQAVGYRGWFNGPVMLPIRFLLVPLGFLLVFAVDYPAALRLALAAGVLGAIYFWPAAPSVGVNRRGGRGFEGD